MNTKLLLAWLVLATFISLPARAGDGHDHGAAPAAATGPALPRFTAASELFELVGVVDGKRLTLYLDRFEDNSPVQGAKVDLDVGGARIALEEHESGEFQGSLAEEPKPGVIAVTATVVAGNETDLLAGELDVHEEEHAEAAPAASWRSYALWGGIAAVVAAALAWAARSAIARRSLAGGAA